MSHNLVDLEHEMLFLTLSLYNNPTIPRNVVQLFVESLINIILSKCMIYIEKVMSTQQFSNTLEVLQFLKRIKTNFENIFSKFKNEHNRFLTYIEKGLMIEPREIEIGYDMINEGTVANPVPVKKPYAAHYVPLSWSLKILLEIPGSFELIKNHLNWKGKNS